MGKILLSLAFTAMIVSAAMLPEVQIRASQQLNKLAKTRNGKNIITAIQLELTSGNSENIVDNIVELLQDLLNQDEDQLTSSQDELATKTDYYTSTVESYEGQIQNKEDALLEAQQQVPVVEGQQALDQQQLASQQDRLVRLTNDLSDANDINDQASAAFNASINNHNRLIDALQQARDLIVQLKSSSFLQTKNKVLAQISSHQKASFASLQNHRARSLFNVLMEMAQEIGIQSDQTLVSSVLDIIDDLLNHEKDGVRDETAAEQLRVQEYNDKVEQLNEGIADANSQIVTLDGELAVIANELEVLHNNINQWTAQLGQLTDTLTALEAQRDADLAALNDRIETLESELDVIQQAINIFQSAAIQDVKPLVDNISVDDDESNGADGVDQ